MLFLRFYSWGLFDILQCTFWRRFFFFFLWWILSDLFSSSLDYLRSFILLLTFALNCSIPFWFPYPWCNIQLLVSFIDLQSRTVSNTASEPNRLSRLLVLGINGRFPCVETECSFIKGAVKLRNLCFVIWTVTSTFLKFFPLLFLSYDSTFLFAFFRFFFLIK